MNMNEGMNFNIGRSHYEAFEIAQPAKQTAAAKQPATEDSTGETVFQKIFAQAVTSNSTSKQGKEAVAPQATENPQAPDDKQVDTELAAKEIPEELLVSVDVLSVQVDEVLPELSGLIQLPLVNGLQQMTEPLESKTEMPLMEPLDAKREMPLTEPLVMLGSEKATVLPDTLQMQVTDVKSSSTQGLDMDDGATFQAIPLEGAKVQDLGPSQMIEREETQTLKSGLAGVTTVQGEGSPLLQGQREEANVENQPVPAVVELKAPVVVDIEGKDPIASVLPKETTVAEAELKMTESKEQKALGLKTQNLEQTLTSEEEPRILSPAKKEGVVEREPSETTLKSAPIETGDEAKLLKPENSEVVTAVPDKEMEASIAEENGLLLQKNNVSEVGTEESEEAGQVAKNVEGLQATTNTKEVSSLELKPQEEPLPAYSQISKEIMKRLDQKGPTEFRMSLEPADLGQIEIKLQISNGKLVIDIAALNSKTQALLANQVDNLVMSMGLQNVKVEVIQAGNNSMTAHETLENQTQAYATGNNAAFSQNSQSSFSQKDSSGNLNRLVASVIRNSESQVNNIDLSAMALGQRPNVTRMDYTI